MNMLNSSSINLVTSVDFSKAPSLSNLTSFHESCSLLNVVRMNQIMHTGDMLDSVGNNHSIIIFYHTKLIMEVNPHMVFTL